MTPLRSIISIRAGARALSTARAGEFADAVGRRHAGRPASPRGAAGADGASMVFRRPLPSAAARILHQHLQLNLSPRIALSVAGARPRGEERAPFERAPAPYPGPAAETRRPVETFARRFIEREVRFDSVAGGRAPAAGPQSEGREPRAAPAPPQDVARRAADRTAAEPAPRPFDADAAGPRRAEAQRAEPAPALDINRLAGQVMEAIDRRIIARRERLGRS